MAWVNCGIEIKYYSQKPTNQLSGTVEKNKQKAFGLLTFWKKH